jgi:glycosyltransferase involved in cell wall biosynthesis
LILGDGAARRGLEQQADEQAAGLVEFRDQVPQERAALTLRASDALLVSLSAAPELAAFVPSKLFDFAAVGRPVVLAAAGEPARLAAKERAALAVPPGDAERLADAVRTVANDADLAARLVEGGRRFALSNLREHSIEAFEGILRSA